MSAPEWMSSAIDEALLAEAAGDVPIGCVIVHDPTNQIIARGRNRREIDHDPTAHAEIVALRAAAASQQSWRLTDCTMIVTLEPCPMCAGALVAARLPRLIYGCDDPKAGAVRTLFRLCDDPRLNHRLTITTGIEADRCAALLKNFFAKQRAQGKK